MMYALGAKARMDSIIHTSGGVRDTSSLRFTSGATPLLVYLVNTVTSQLFLKTLRGSSIHDNKQLIL